MRCNKTNYKKIIFLTIFILSFNQNKSVDYTLPEVNLTENEHTHFMYNRNSILLNGLVILPKKKLCSMPDF
jgi:hypothetical protein